MQGKILSLKEVANLLGVSERTVMREIAAGKIVAFKVGRILRFESQEVEAYIKRQQVQPEREKVV